MTSRFEVNNAHTKLSYHLKSSKDLILLLHRSKTMETQKKEEIKLSRVQKLLKNRKLIVEPIVCILFFAIFLSGKH